MLKMSIFFLSVFLCLNMGMAQTSPPPVAPGPTVQQTAPSAPGVPQGVAPVMNAPSTLTAPGTTTTPSSTDALTSIVGSIQTTAGKYEEYQSICRFIEYDTPAFLPGDVQQNRLDLLEAKFKTTKSPIKLKLQILKEYIDQGKKAEAEKFYQKLKEEKMSETDSKTADALASVNRKEIKKAESTLAKIVLDDPKNAEALTFLADIYKNDGNYFEAISAYMDLSKLTKDNFDLQLCEAQTLDSQHADADKSCKKAVQKYESDPYPLIFLGISQREKMNYLAADKYFKDSIRKKQTEMGFACLAEIYFIKEKFSDSAELFRRALKISPNSVRSQLGLAWAEFKDKKIAEALTNFKLACSKDRRVKAELRKAFKILSLEKSTAAKQFADLAQNCTE